MGATPYGVGAGAGHRGTYTGPNGTTLRYNYKVGAAVQGADGAGYAHGSHGAAVTGSGGDTLPRGF